MTYTQTQIKEVRLLAKKGFTRKEISKKTKVGEHSVAYYLKPKKTFTYTRHSETLPTLESKVETTQTKRVLTVVRDFLNELIEITA